MTEKQNLHGKLPLELPKPCPICGARVYLNAVTQWGTEDGEIESIEYDCETEPDIDSKAWPEWHRGHYHMPYVDWLPYEIKALDWLNARYFYRHESAGCAEQSAT